MTTSISNMRRFIGVTVLCLLGAALVLVGATRAQTKKPVIAFDDGREVLFLDGEEATGALLDNSGDAFFDALTSIDMSVRLRTELDPTKRAENLEQFKELIRSSVMAWEPNEIEAVVEVVEIANGYAASVHPDLAPRRWKFIKTDGREEGGNFYTRAGCTILPEMQIQTSLLAGKKEQFVHILLHEMFHIYSANNPRMRQALYEVIGFQAIDSLDLGPYLTTYRLTNPDGINHRYMISYYNHDSVAIDAVPVVYSNERSYVPSKPSLVNYLQFGLFEVVRDGQVWKIKEPGDATTPPEPLELTEATGFFDQIGTNTQYIIHPDGILAENVAFLCISKHVDAVAGRLGDAGMEFLERIEAALAQR